MSGLVDRLDRALYPRHSKNWDDLIFRECILSHLSRSSTVLDLGAGAGIVEQMNFKGMAAQVCGVDLDPRVVENPMLDEGRVASVDKIPYPNDKFDVVYADNVVEHLPDPFGVFREVHRVLKPGGAFLFKTPNRTHYMPTIARVTPYRFHKFVNRLRGRAEIDTFPTHYRANTANDVRKLSIRTELEIERLDRIEGRPEYLRFAWPAYLVGAAYERFVNSTEKFAMFRVLLIVEMRKPSTEHMQAGR